MKIKTENSIKTQIEKITKELGQIKEMRPGTLSQQYGENKNKKYYQLSYTYKMKSKTEYIRPQFVADVKKQVKEYMKFKTLTEKWIDLSIELSRLKMGK